MYMCIYIYIYNIQSHSSMSAARGGERAHGFNMDSKLMGLHAMIHRVEDEIEG